MRRSSEQPSRVLPLRGCAAAPAPAALADALPPLTFFRRPCASGLRAVSARRHVWPLPHQASCARPPAAARLRVSPLPHVPLRRRAVLPLCARRPPYVRPPRAAAPLRVALPLRESDWAGLPAVQAR